MTASNTKQDSQEKSPGLKRCEKELARARSNLEWTHEQLIRQKELASVGKLTAGIIHEIKNPLGFISNFSELSLEQISEFREKLSELDSASHIFDDFLETMEENFYKIFENGNRANDIVRSMLRQSTGGKGIKEPTEINSFIRKFVTLAYHSMRASSNAINVCIEMDLDTSIKEVKIIREEFSRVIVNICDNAFDAMRSALNEEPAVGYLPKLIIQTTRRGNHIAIEIEDNGPGIPVEIASEIMEPFFTTKDKSGGTGLGLSIANDIVSKHGGSLRVNSVIGTGSTFKIELPL